MRVTMQVHYQQLERVWRCRDRMPGHAAYCLRRTKTACQRNWYHGFYAEYRPNEGRTICDACWEEHEQINKDAWYTYESGNLFTDWPEGQRPALD